MEKIQSQRSLGKIITYFLLAVWAVLVLFPFYWMVMTSFKSYSAYNGEFIPQLIVLSPTVENYFEAFRPFQLSTFLALSLL